MRHLLAALLVILICTAQTSTPVLGDPPIMLTLAAYPGPADPSPTPEAYPPPTALEVVSFSAHSGVPDVAIAGGLIVFTAWGVWLAVRRRKDE